MISQPKLHALTLLAALAVAGFTSQASAACSTCGVPAATYSAGYAAPVAYTTAYAPVSYTTAYAPAYTTHSSGWYPGYWLGRANRAIWGYPTTTYYAPTYTAAYAPTYTAAYAPAYTTSYAPTASYAPACSTCTTSCAPACSSCSASYAPACSTCSTGTVSQATYTEVVAAPATTTYGTPSTTSSGPTPAISPDANIPVERVPMKAGKPVPADPPLQPEPAASSTDEGAATLQAPELFAPTDRTAERHAAPVWTAVYHRASGAEPIAQRISWQQAERDAEGWASASE